MYGTVMAFSHELKAGYISGDDGEQYIFSFRDWRSTAGPTTDLKVSFETACGEAMNITRN